MTVERLGDEDVASRLLARRAASIHQSAIDDTTSILQRQPRDVISLAVGSPAPEAVPSELMAGLAADALGRTGALDYAPTEGDPGLRRRLLSLLAARGEPVADASLLVTSGGMQGLDLAGKLLLDPGDLVVTESPTYTNGICTIRGYEAEVLGVPVDEEGMRVDEIPARLAERGRSPKLFYVIPSYQNPSGATLSLARRHRLLELAEHYDAIVLEDDPYGWLHFEERPPASLWRLDGGRGRVVSVATFSKIVAPGLRVGWVLAPSPLVTRMIAAKQAMDTCANSLAQRLLDAFIGEGDFEVHIDRLRTTYRGRHQVLQAALRRHLGSHPGATWSTARGGFFLWVRLPGVDSTALLPDALREGVAYIPGPAFATAGGFEDCLRLGFSGAPSAELAEAVRRLALAVGH
ncbi:MAG: PLP-dependent aminotransferase family protein [Candidatus Dormiibacterota bacterium]